jgi:hypothetical protein
MTKARSGRLAIRIATRIVTVVTAAALLAGTAYVGYIANSWHERVTELRRVAAELDAQRTEAETLVEAGAESLADKQADLDAAHHELVVSANHGVKSADAALYFTYAGQSMGKCIDAEENVEFYVRTKWTSPDPHPWTATHKYDDDVRKACNKIRKYFTDAVDELAPLFAESDAAEDES